MSAFEKLQHGDILDGPIVTHETIAIDMASPGYYAKKTGESEAVLEPIWMLFGDSSSGSRLGFYIYARQFANFTATPTVGSYPLTVQFTDTSEASPIRWYWEFGDGANSTEQNPSHMYRIAGNYTVNLTAWNDLGSDTETKPVQVTG